MASYYDYAKLSFRRPRGEEEVDPLSSVANIADAMLVFACGILIALIVAWNVDVNKVVQVEIDRIPHLHIRPKRRYRIRISSLRSVL